MSTMTLPLHDCIIHFNAYLVKPDITLRPYTQAGDSAPVAAVCAMQRRTAGSGRAKPVNVPLPTTVNVLTQHLR